MKMKFKLTTPLILRAMKKLILIIAVLLACFLGAEGREKTPAGAGPQTDEYITVSCSPDLLPLAREWVKEYNAFQKGITINLREPSAGHGEHIMPGAAFGFISEAYLGDAERDMRKMVIAREVTVPVIHSSCPYRNEIYGAGVDKESLTRLLTDPGKQDWATLTRGAVNHSLQLYILDEAGLVRSLTAYLGIEATDITAHWANNAEEMVSAIGKDPYAVGICHLADITDPLTNDYIAGIGILPIDRNGNGQLEYFENIYTNPDMFTRSLWVGKYPRELTGRIYLVTPDDGLTGGAAAFMKWMLTEGQAMLGAYGYSDLALGEVRSNLDHLVPQQPVLVDSHANYAGLKVILMLVVLSILAGIILESVLLYRRYRKGTGRNVITTPGGRFHEEGINVPKGLFFDKTHTWAFMQTDGKVSIGLDDFLARITGPLTGIRMRNPGESIKKGEVILSIIQKGKQLNIKAPVSGVILENNQRLAADASLINSEPYSGGWIYTIEPSNWLREIQLMYMADRFRSWLQSEFARLKDFFAMEQNSQEIKLARLVYQDGGELKAGVLCDLSPEVWEDFQTRFMETNS